MKKIVPVFPWPMPAKLAEALAAIDGIEPVEALPGGPGPILAIKEPTFVCDAIMVRDPQRVSTAVQIITADGIEMVSMRDHLSKLVAGGVSETVETRLSGVKFQ